MDAGAVETFLALLRVSGDLLAALDVHLARYKMSQGRFTLLTLLKSSAGHQSTPSLLAEQAGVTRATVTGLLDGLERDGMIQRSHDTQDRRAVCIQLTHKGQQFLDETLPDHFRRISRLMKHLNEDERRQMMQLLEKLSLGLPEMLNP
jgi:DNA-binding MarR family transcriptional regulator